jgi:hypothetical protein
VIEPDQRVRGNLRPPPLLRLPNLPPASDPLVRKLTHELRQRHPASSASDSQAKRCSANRNRRQTGETTLEPSAPRARGLAKERDMGERPFFVDV